MEIVETLKQEGKLERVGCIGDGGQITWAPLILVEGKEKEMGTEELVVVENLNGNAVLAVCRSGYGRSPSLQRSRYSPGRAYARLGEQPSSSRESFDFNLSVVGEVTSETVRQSKLILAPRSAVYRFTSGNPFSLMGISEEYEVGYYKDHPAWKVPALPKYVPYHLGAFCTTGWGKTSLVRSKIIPLLQRTGYGVIVFDWKGDDYVPYYDRVISGHAIGEKIEERVASLVSFILGKTGYFGFGTDSSMGKAGEKGLEHAVNSLDLDELARGEAFKRELLEQLPASIDRYASHYIDDDVKKVTKHYIQDIPPEAFDAYLEHEKQIQRHTPDAIIGQARQKHELVVDLSGMESNEKLDVFLSIARRLRYLMDVEKEKVGAALVIDEGPQYCPYRPSGIQAETMKVIVDLAALGRSYGLPIVLLSQGIAGDIGINAAVRRNINTWFIGKVHPLDRREAEELLPDVNLDFLQSLDVGHFYFFGNMSPSPVPLLIRFELNEDE
ncbi:MAG: ATP-binding protein [Candidatus Korarchaeota archaeon]|nr:ATP-binding protein [Candidatus Korarchaeota archaeon]